MSALPEGFADLEGFVGDFARDTAFARDAVRGSTPLGRRQEFHAALAPRLRAVLERLDAVPLAEHDLRERTLMQLALTYAHIAQSIEVQGPDEDKHTRARARLPITRAPADV